MNVATELWAKAMELKPANQERAYGFIVGLSVSEKLKEEDKSDKEDSDNVARR